ncbi:MAG: hydrogenase maturation protease [Flavobacteriaceae bacterium]|nr:MAG: hydrogenase maturation protease [Flavobacteriaceae bacterium]
MLKGKTKDLLIIGIGNSGRSDDGLGWELLGFIEKTFPHIECLYRYQLQVEDAFIISDYETVLFIDATHEVTEKGYYFRPCSPNQEFGLTSHALEPTTVLWLENKLYKKNPKAYILGVQGFKWELSSDPSENGLINLNKAKAFLKEQLSTIHISGHDRSHVC